ncbi:MAG: sigma-70 family RNA polymerase sigma factor [Clostridia bacterium]|nr:sigma-70 family RNA polymerase sigma factor [Clostridia bacterium]
MLENGVSSYHRYLQGDDSALEELVRSYSDTLVRFAYCFVRDSSAAEDVVQDAFVSLVLKRRQFSDCDNFRAYLYKIVRNKCMDYLRFHKKRAPLQDAWNVADGSSPEREAQRTERNKVLYHCLQTLPRQYSEVLYLVYFEEYTIERVGAILKKTKKQVYNALARAKLALKAALEKEGFSYEDL